MPRDNAEFSAPSQEEFDDFVARTREETGRLAFALTGNEAAAAELAERAYADARPIWASGEQATRQRVRERLLHHARRGPSSPAALEAVAESGWPEIGVDTERIAARSGAVRSRRKLLGLGAAGALVLGLGAGARQTYRWVTEDSAAPAPSLSALDLGPQLARRTVRVDRLVTLDLVAHGATENPTLVVTHEGSMLGSTRMGDRPALLRLPHPNNEFQAVQLAMTPPAEWIHLSGSGVDSLVMKPVDLLERSVAVEAILDDWHFTELAAGLRSGDFLGSPATRITGSKLGPQLWAYSVDRLSVVHGGEPTLANMPIEEAWGVWSARGAKWGLVIGLEGNQAELQGIDRKDYRWIRPDEHRMGFIHIPAPNNFPQSALVVPDQEGKELRIPLHKL